MLKVKPEYLSKRGRREFVVLTVEDFERMKEALEDAEDLRALRRATARNVKAPYYTAAQVDRLLRTRLPGARKRVDRLPTPGSFNFTRAAEEENAENVLILHNQPQIQSAYEDNFRKHLAHSELFDGK